MLVHCRGLSWIYVISLLSKVCSSSSIAFKDALSYNFWSSPIKMNRVVPMHCEAEGFTAGLGQHIRIIKSIRGPKNGLGQTKEVARVVLATNNRVEDSFRNLKNYQNVLKYSANLEIPGDKGILTFTIRGVTGEDQGGYVCEVLGEDGELRTSEMKILSVLVPISEVFISQLLRNGTEIRVPAGSQLAMYENIRGGIACNVHVDNAITDPEVKVTADGTDITNLFTDLAPLDEVSRLPGSAYRYRYTTWRKKSYFTISPSLKLNEKAIICSAHTPGYEETTMTASVMLRVEAQPEVNCEKLEYLARPGDEANLNCQVRSNPDGQIFFRLKDGNDAVEEVVRLDALGKFTERGLDFRANKAGHTTNVTIGIPSVQTEHYNYKYTIEAINEYGTREQALYLYKIGRYSNSATNVLISRTLLILIIFLTLNCH